MNAVIPEEAEVIDWAAITVGGVGEDKVTAPALTPRGNLRMIRSCGGVDFGTIRTSAAWMESDTNLRDPGHEVTLDSIRCGILGCTVALFSELPNSTQT